MRTVGGGDRGGGGGGAWGLKTDIYRYGEFRDRSEIGNFYIPGVG